KASFEWAGQTMTRPENFLGVWPVIRNNRLKGGTLFIAAEKNTSEAAVRLGAELAGLWEMKRSFTDPAELDGIITAVYHLPLIAQEAYLNCLITSPGWADREKAIDKSSVGSLFPGPENPDHQDEVFSLLNSRDDCVQQLNELIGRLLVYRNALAGGNEPELKKLLEMNGPLRKAGSADQRPTDPDVVSAGEVMRQTFFGGFLRKNRRQ
ncbi:MAG: hypothetical protein IKP86_09025, partial [Anaerolineaceae bacterium]|nr:hypothetical protein [Anaerolineaceae bacterium]